MPDSNRLPEKPSRQAAPPEQWVRKVWQEIALQTGLFTEEGTPINVIYPGRANDGRGADLRDAVILDNHGLKKGDIEVHVRSSDWRAHGHNLNPDYDRVILHVVYWHNSPKAVNLHNGNAIGTLSIRRYSGSRHAHPGRGLPCRDAMKRMGKETLTSLIAWAGQERFMLHAAHFQSELLKMEAGQSLYEGVMESLGYSANKLPFLELARRLPLRVLETRMNESDGDFLARCQALLLGTAGLLQRSNQDIERVEELERLQANCGRESMSEKDWCLFKIRPNNSPVRRLAAMSRLLVRFRRRGILEELISTFSAAPAGDFNILENALMVEDEDLSPLCRGRAKTPALIGRERASDIIVNVVLPFMFGWGKFTNRPSLEAKALEFYRHYPALQPNTLARHMKGQLDIDNGMLKLAQLQQGLIHIYKTLCAEGKCHQCPLQIIG